MERFIKCDGCKVNIPKDDMLALGQCTVCKRPYTATDGSNVSSDQNISSVPIKEQKPKRKRWATLVSKRGRTYYHNTETGEDRWDKPPDFEAEANENAFVPFKNDTVKNALLREQMKQDAVKKGIPIEMVTAVQESYSEDNSIDKLLQEVSQQENTRPQVPPAQAKSVPKPTEPSKLDMPVTVPSKTSHMDKSVEEMKDKETGSNCTLS